MTLINVYPLHTDTLDILYQLLKEREPNQNISHKELPPYSDHTMFVANKPYKAWYLIHHNNMTTGAIYLTHQNEIGIQVFKEFSGSGIGREAVELLMSQYNGPFLANINPKNEASISLFTKLGGKKIQETYEIHR